MSVNNKTGRRPLAMRAAVMAAAAAVMMTSVSAFALDPGYRAPDPENTLVIDTTKGQVIIELYPLLAPASTERMRTLAHQHFYDGLIFHRVMEDFMDQTGDPKGDGTGGSTLPNIKAEFTARHDSSFPLVAAAHPAGVINGFVGAMPVASQVNELMPLSKDGKVQAWGLYCQGTVGLARDNDPDSGNSQFFLMRAANSNLERNYTAVGTVLTGLDVVRKIKIGSPAVDPDKMVKVRVLSDIPANERPNILVMDTQSAQFKALIEKTRKDKGADFSPCDINVPVKVLK